MTIFSIDLSYEYFSQLTDELLGLKQMSKMVKNTHQNFPEPKSPQSKDIQFAKIRLRKAPHFHISKVGL